MQAASVTDPLGGQALITCHDLPEKTFFATGTYRRAVIGTVDALCTRVMPNPTTSKEKPMLCRNTILAALAAATIACAGGEAENGPRSSTDASTTSDTDPADNAGSDPTDTNDSTGDDADANGTTTDSNSTPPPPEPDTLIGRTPWPMFHNDAAHTGLVAEGKGSVDESAGPVARWTYRVDEAPADHDLVNYRWYSNFPLGDVDGDGTVETIVTSARGAGLHARILVLKDVPDETPTVRRLWQFDVDTYAQGGVDQYAAALADADGDGLPDVLFTTNYGTVYCLKGTTGDVLWQYDTGRLIEAGPVVADLDDDGANEVIVPADCLYGEDKDCGTSDGALYVFALAAPDSGLDNPPQWSMDLPYKADSLEPTIADLDPNDGTDRKGIVLGTWGGDLLVIWRTDDGRIISRAFDIRTLDTEVDTTNAVVRSTPVITDYGQGPTAVFGWMPNYSEGYVARMSAVRIVADLDAETVAFTGLWTINRDVWKSSVALLPRAGDTPLFVAGYGIGTRQGTGNYGECNPTLTGGVLGVDVDGNIAWEDAFMSETNVRGSVAVVDIDGDDVLEVLVPIGCFGKLAAYDGQSGAREWDFQLGPRTIASPSVADLDGNGSQEVIIASYDGQVWALGGEE